MLKHALKFCFISALAIQCSVASYSQNVIIIESQSANSGHVMDIVWEQVAANLGMNAVISPQSTLFDTLFFATTDALIVSSGVIILSGTQINTITQFMESGKNLYLQGEYDCNAYNTNSTFESLVDNNGGDFSWNGIVAGTLAPMVASGTLATTPNIVSPLSYFWYGCRGTACKYVEPFLEYNNDQFGFIFCPPQNDYGRVICTTDQDWINQSTSLPLMENILTLITSGTYQCSGSNYLSANLGSDTTICTDSSMVLSGGSNDFDYLWSTGSTDSNITVTAGGLYWVTVSNGLCSVSDSILLTEIPCTPFAASFGASDTLLCEKFCIDYFDLSSNNPVSWSWSFEGADPATSTDQNPVTICYDNPGTFDVTLITTDASGNNDTISLTDFIIVYQNPFAPVITQNGNTLTSSPADSYQWLLNSVEIPGATNQSYEITQSGLYTAVIEDPNGCSAQSDIKATLVGIGEIFSGSVIIYPNPSPGSFIIEYHGDLNESLSISVINSLGQVILSFEEQATFSPWKQEIDLSDFPEAIYFIELKSEAGIIKQKIILTNQ